jgi:hypothetical protein
VDHLDLFSPIAHLGSVTERHFVNNKAPSAASEQHVAGSNLHIVTVNGGLKAYRLNGPFCRVRGE